MGALVKGWLATWADTVDMNNSRSPQWLVASWYEDLKANRGYWTGAGFQAVAVHRFGVWAKSQTRIVRLLADIVYRTAYWGMRNVYGVELPRGAVIGRRLSLPHAMGVVVSRQAVIGDDCMIRQGATIGRFDRGRKRIPPYAPKLGNEVQVGAGAVIVGGVTVGDGARIGPNAVVMTDVPSGGSGFARPAGVMEPLGDRDEE